MSSHPNETDQPKVGYSTARAFFHVIYNLGGRRRRHVALLMLEALMMLADISVLECNSADAAWLLLEQTPIVDLVITDICMPGKIDGWELANRCWAKRPAMPLIITSGHLRVTEDELPVGSSFMAKPWTLDHLYEMVDHHIPAA